MTVVARWTPGLPRDEVHPIGYRILRIEAGPLDGVPLPGRLRRRRQRRDGVKRGARPAGSESSAGPATKARRPLAAPLRALHAAIAPFGRSLTFRGLSRAAAAVSPPADLYHAIGYPRLPVALALGRRDRAPVDLRRGRRLPRFRAQRRGGQVRPLVPRPWRAEGRARRGSRRHGERCIRRRDAAAVRRHLSAGHLELLVPLRAADPAGAALPRAPRARRRRRVVLYHGNFFAGARHRAAHRAPSATSRAGYWCSWAVGRSRRRCEPPWRRTPMTARSGSPHRCRPRSCWAGSPAPTRRRADPAGHAEPPPEHAPEAVRGHGRGRAGRRKRPARDGADRPRHGLRGPGRHV